jgi:hypothetical protein
MNPTFFPSTWIPEAHRNILLSCFRQVTVLQPERTLVPAVFRHLERNGRLDIRLADEGSHGETAQTFPELLKAYHAWADLHQGERPDVHKFAKFAAPPPDDTSTAWIRDRIRHHAGHPPGSRGTPAGQEAAPLLAARLFLAIAQTYDQEHESLARDLDDIGAMEKNLFRNLSPEEQPSSFPTAWYPAGSGFKAERSFPDRRLAAWRRLYAHCHTPAAGPKPLPPFFVTNDGDALHLLLDPPDTPEVVCRIEVTIPVGEAPPFAATAAYLKIDEKLRSAAQGIRLSAAPTFSLANQAGGTGGAGTLTIYRMQGNPVTAYHPGSSGGSESSRALETGNAPPFTLIGHLEGNCALDSPKQLV